MHLVTSFFRKLFVPGLIGLGFFTLFFQFLPTFFTHTTNNLGGQRALDKTFDALSRSYQPIFQGDFTDLNVLVAPIAGFVMGALWKILKDA